MHQWALPTIAVMLLAYGAVSGRLRSIPVSQAMVFVTLGLLAGNRILGLVEADTANQFVRHLAEATLALVLFCDAVRVNRGRLRHEAALPTRLLGVGLPLTIVAGTLAALVLVFWGRPTGKVVLGLTLALLAALAVIEFLGRPPGRRAGELSTSQT